MIAIATCPATRAGLALGCAAAILLLGGCITAPPDAFRPLPGRTADAGWQTRRFDGVTEKAILSACAGVLQDLGFNLEESEGKLGLIVASKDRSARKQQTTTQKVAQKSAEIAASIVLSALAAQPVYAGDSDPPERQVLRASLMITPVSSSSAFNVRVTFQRIVHNRSNRIRSIETLLDPELTRAFFEALSKSSFLDRHLP